MRAAERGRLDEARQGVGGWSSIARDSRWIVVKSGVLWGSAEREVFLWVCNGR
jgi:hypothetical protein